MGCGGSGGPGPGAGDGSVPESVLADGASAVGALDSSMGTIDAPAIGTMDTSIAANDTSGVPGQGDAGTPFGEEDFPPTVTQQIAQDLADGTIDVKTAALYELLAQFSPGRLPEKYDAEQLFANPPSVLSMLTAQAHLEEYGPVEKAAVQAMLASPEEDGWMVFPAGMPKLRAGQGTTTKCMAQFDVGDEGQKARVFGDEITTTHFAIHALLPISITIPKWDQIRTRITKALDSGFGSYLDSVYEKYKNSFKMMEPSKLKAVVDHGGRIPVYVATCDGANEAYSVSDGFIFVSVEAGFDSEDLRRVLIPHEAFHVFEFGYTNASSNDDNQLGWPYEAFAVGVEDLYAPDVRRWSGRLLGSPLFPALFFVPMSRSFKCPEEPLHSSYDGLCMNRHSKVTKTRGDYGKFVLVKFLMRNRRLVPGEFWQSFADAKGDPRKLINPEDAAEFEFALIGDSIGKTPYFDPDDRAAFFTPGAVSCDLDTKETRRYTLWLDSGKLVSDSKLLRAAPSDRDGRADGEGLVSLDSASLPIPPWGTHRLLIQIPPEAAFTEPNVSPIHIYLKYPAAANVSASAVTFDETGLPGRTFNTFDKGAPTASSSVNTTTSSLFLRTPADGPLPGFVLVLISNYGDTPLTYQGAVNFPNACDKACNDYYTGQIDSMGCMSQWCYEDCSKSSEPGKCNDNVQKCTDKTSPTTYDMAKMEIGYFCTYACWPYNDLNKPVNIPCGKPACGICWDEKVCGGTCDTSKPAGFYSTSQWPQMECLHWLQSGQAKCP